MMFDFRQEGSVSIVYFQNTRILDEATVQTLGTDLLEAAARARNGKLLLNFRNVMLMSSAVINKLVDLRNRCDDAAIQLGFCEISEGVKEVFTIMRLQDLVKLYTDEQSALAEMQEM